MEHLIELRKQKKLLQKDIAKYLNVSRPTYCTWENGQYEPDNKNLIKLADFFDVTVDYLLDRENQEFFTSANIPKTEIQALYDSLNSMQQQSVLGYIKGLKSVEQRKYNI